MLARNCFQARQTSGGWLTRLEKRHETRSFRSNPAISNQKCDWNPYSANANDKKAPPSVGKHVRIQCFKQTAQQSLDGLNYFRFMHVWPKVKWHALMGNLSITPKAYTNTDWPTLQRLWQLQCSCLVDVLLIRLNFSAQPPLVQYHLLRVVCNEPVNALSFQKE